MLAGMGLLLDSFWRAVVYCLRPRVIGLSLLPLFVLVALALGLGYFYWDVSVQGMRNLLEASALLGSLWSWLQGWGLGDVASVVAPLIVVLATAPILVVLSLLMVAVFMTPAWWRWWPFGVFRISNARRAARSGPVSRGLWVPRCWLWWPWWFPFLFG